MLVEFIVAEVSSARSFDEESSVPFASCLILWRTRLRICSSMGMGELRTGRGVPYQCGGRPHGLDTGSGAAKRIPPSKSSRPCTTLDHSMASMPTTVLAVSTVPAVSRSEISSTSPGTTVGGNRIFHHLPMSRILLYSSWYRHVEFEFLGDLFQNQVTHVYSTFV